MGDMSEVFSAMAGELLTSCGAIGAAAASDDSHRSVYAFEKNIAIVVKSQLRNSIGLVGSA
jgi:hypothetical protein